MAKFLFLLGLLALVQLSLQQDCSATKLCRIGCCSSSGYCGFGPEYCAKPGCQSGCERKADCNPGTWGPDGSQWSKSDKCPLNVCCSEFGFCGTTEEFCQGNPVNRPSCNINDVPITRVIGYYESWAPTNRPCYNMLPEQIPYGYYTDIIFSFATINPQTFEIEAGDGRTAEYMQRISAIKLIQPKVRLWIAVGGWAFNDPGPTRTTFSDMTSSRANMDKFIESLVGMMALYGFDGVDIDWEYPVAEDRGGRGPDHKNFVTFMELLYFRMKMGIRFRSKLVSLTLPASYWYLQHFDIVNLEHSVDWFNIMSYDMHGSWDIPNRWTGPYANSHTNMTEIQDALDLLWRNNISPKKVTFGMAFYARSFNLESESCNTLRCRVVSGGNAGRCSRTTGVLLHPEIAEEVRARGLTPTLHREGAVKEVAWGDQWVTFDDAATWRLKANIIRGQCIPGVMVWAMSHDDKDGTNIKALTSAIGRRRIDVPDFSPDPEPMLDLPQTSKLCRWSGCFRDCPPGFKVVLRDGHGDEIMGNGENCFNGNGFSKLCCPENDIPVCTWRGHSNSGNCNPGCTASEVEVGSLGIGCRTGHQTACCTFTGSTWAYGQCKWSGCGEECSGEWSAKAGSAWQGAGGEYPCPVDQRRNYCCKNGGPADFGNCAWVQTGNPPRFDIDLVCEDSCASNQVKIATESGGGFGGITNGCLGGSRALCCNEPEPEPVAPRDTTFGGIQNQDFRLLLEDYMRNPTCPATILDIVPGSRFVNKRSLIVEAAEHDILLGRAIDCNERHFNRLVQWGAILITEREEMLGPLESLYDNLFADSFDEQLRIDNMRPYYHDIPDNDPLALMRYVFLYSTVAGPAIRREQRTAEIFCTLPSNRKRSLVLPGSASLEVVAPRFISYMPTSIPGIPDAERIYTGINVGHLTLHYARWQFFSGRNFPDGPMLELAYWIGPEPGVDSVGDPDLDQYRDTDRSEDGPPDRWVVLHLHINTSPGVEWLRTMNGRTHIGIQRITMFHGQTIDNPPDADWRVSGRDHSGLNRRDQSDGFQCPDDALWYPGAPVEIPAEDGSEFWTTFHNWGANHFLQGYFSTEALRYITDGSRRLSNGDIDPNNPGRFTMVTERHPTFGEFTFRRNFRIARNVATGALEPRFGVDPPQI